MKIFITEVIIDVGDLKSGLKFLLRILVKILVKIWIKNFQIKYFKIIWHKIRGGFLDPFQIRITDRDLSVGNLAIVKTMVIVPSYSCLFARDLITYPLYAKYIF